MQWRVVLVLLITVLCLIALGGFIFFMVEANNEQALRQEAVQKTRLFLRDYPCVSESDYWYLAERVITEYQRGVLALRNRTLSTNWDIMSSVYFSTTVLTTIGYGHISPLTSSGRIFCVFYALLGIPLTLLFFIGLGGRLARLRTTSRAGAFLTASIVLIGGVCVFMLLAAIMFWKIEGWPYHDALYFVFFTLTTIGFGDLVPGQSQTAAALPWYRLVVAGWIFVSMIWLSTTLILWSDAIKGGFKGKKKKVEDPEPAAKTTNSEPVFVVRSEQLAPEVEQLELTDASGRRRSIAALTANSDMRRKSITQAYDKSSEVEELELELALARGRRKSLGAIAGDGRRKSVAQITSQDEDALRDAVQDALVARAYREIANQQATIDAVASAAAMTSPEAVAAAAASGLPVAAPRAAVARAMEEAVVDAVLTDTIVTNASTGVLP